ncbi:uncharacterized protein LOC142985575 [Anticarsia gemmatalis]|uniref:uncharacterized protein LOC142985575 n=1 Tax=Anticarsia gemmatalis TaxID=129554 RepID=UPI003F76F0D6
MKEININIEGYNVNGICVGCLNYNRRMRYDPEIKQCFKILGDIEVPDGLEIQVCWECIAYVKKAMRFRDQILRSYDFLISYSQTSTFLESPKVFESQSTTRISQSAVRTEPDECRPFTDEKDFDVKTEDGNYEFECPVEVPIEVPIKEEIEQFEFPFELPSPVQDASSEDDIQLSKLKKNKVKKKKKKKELQEELTEDNTKTETVSKRKKKTSEDRQDASQKTSRKLKNLPENLVELYTMTEDEMWEVRQQDKNSPEFTKMKHKCEHCIIVFNTRKLHQDHMNGKHRPKGPSSHQCPICLAYFVTKDHLSRHRALHLSAFKCALCSVKSSLKCRMLKHLAQHTHAPTYHCQHCGTHFSTKSKLTYHRAVCKQEKPQCDCCGKVFANKMTLKYHLKVADPQNKTAPKEKMYIPCKGCDKVFHSKKSYRSHVVIHDGVTYPCPICGKLFQWKRNLARHTRNHREREAGELHECRACSKSFASRDCYNNHMRLSKRHVPPHHYLHECNYCGKKFATKWCLTDHIDWDHLKRIKYQCRVCFKAFKTAKIMVAHINNIHEGKNKEDEGEHLCEICGKSYKTVKRLKGHVWAMHTKRTNTKSFKCKLCPATFTWQTSIYKHMKMMHDVNKKTPTKARAIPVKKEEPYPGIDLANRMQYFQQNIAGNLNIVHIQPLQVTQNLV